MWFEARDQLHDMEKLARTLPAPAFGSMTGSLEPQNTQKHVKKHSSRQYRNPSLLHSLWSPIHTFWTLSDGRLGASTFAGSGLCRRMITSRTRAGSKIQARWIKSDPI
jgi:hypothetical protein